MATFEELKELLIDIPCANCGETVFTLPYVQTSHRLLCTKCNKGTVVKVDKSGSILVNTQAEVYELYKGRIEAIMDNLYCTNCADKIYDLYEDDYATKPLFTLSGHTVTATFRCMNTSNCKAIGLQTQTFELI